MRIIGGNLKGRSLEFLKSDSTRPLKDSVKENIFNILTHSNKIDVKIEKADVLDLYSGIGSFGLECISRDANSVTFIEKEIQPLNILKKNISNLSIQKKTHVINDKIENIGNWDLKKKFTIIFMDPPYADFKFIRNLKILKKKIIYNNKHIIIIHREKKSVDDLKDLLTIKIERVYSRSKMIFAKF